MYARITIGLKIAVVFRTPCISENIVAVGLKVAYLGECAGFGLSSESGCEGDAADDRLELPHVPLERRRRGHNLREAFHDFIMLL